MSLAFRNEIDVTVLLSGSTIADVAILPRSRPPLARLFAGKPVSSLPSVLPRLFSLCSAAHEVAFLSAVEAARDETVASEVLKARIDALIAERLTELLRGFFVGRSLGGGSAAAVRALMRATTVLGGGLAERREAVSQIREALTALGIAGGAQQTGPGSVLAAHLSGLDGDALLLPAVEQSFLSAADDLDVVLRLLADGPAFSDAPDLDGQIPETGVWARQGRHAPASPLVAGPADRLKARSAEVALLCTRLETDETAADDGVVASYWLGRGRGAAAVECARGRLYHVVEIDGDRIARFEFLAPTEWNFHARGPLVRSLRGSELGPGRQGRDAVRALVDCFDPCVGVSLGFREVGHA
ncbi:nickel-dependent hydrogenase large subunit [Bradyrhizobium sp. Cp5.3]|uniref:nickel-dependent hydrogenase large subunit n=1 Tax=Bradyrhizobium sp. Cp5.3 TaxID=443598 RepID=UPI0003FB67B5|nr:nickel-dependent hydrogenase large subunit [Bradyrhizobium sp. Cp5.3]